MKKFVLSFLLMFLLSAPVLAVEEVEPNDTEEEATLLDFTNGGAKISGELMRNHDRDYYRYKHLENTRYDITIKNTGADHMQFIDKNGIDVYIGKEKSHTIAVYGEGTGVFYVSLWRNHSEDDSTTYELEIKEIKQSDFGNNEPENDKEETAPVIEFNNGIWKSGSEHISHHRDRDYYRYEYKENTKYEITIKNTGADHMQLIDTSGTDIYAGEEKNHTIAVYGEGTGVFYVSLWRNNSGIDSTTYELEMREIKESDSGDDIVSSVMKPIETIKGSLEPIEVMPVQKKSVTKRTMKFKDIKQENKFYSAVDYVYSNGIVDGYEDETFKTENAINRAEFTKIIMTSSSFENQIESCNNDSYAFPDTKGTWMAKYVCVAKQNGIIKGYDNGQFKPGKTIQLSEALKIIFKVYNIDAGDAQAGDAWFTPYYRMAENNGLLAGVEKNPAKELTRGEAVQLIYNMRGYTE
ncbi:hypothetical protein COB57_01385 [Candidatus Peregrinibacteria bacterium]|nr:MAG: hypothetical protein COB57_01385 [Candidatus Peregrinibacteria bacterium]